MLGDVTRIVSYTPPPTIDLLYLLRLSFAGKEPVLGDEVETCDSLFVRGVCVVVIVDGVLMKSQKLQNDAKTRVV